MLKLDIQMFASTNKTTNYELPQFVGTDKPTWLGDFNGAMATIDAGMHENATDISDMASDVASASSAASQASSDVASLSSTVSSLSSDVSTATTTANNAQSTATSALNTANTANGKADTNASAITTINSNIAGLQGTILWTNPNVNNSFAGQTVTLSESLANYDSYEILYRQSSSVDRIMSTGILPVGHGCFMAFPLSLNNYRGTSETVSGNTLTFLDAYHAQADGSWLTDNSLVIPRNIIGYKTNTIQ